MSQTIESIEAEVLKLPRNERAKVVIRLLDSLEQGQSETSPEAMEIAWVEESVRRLDSYHSGEMEAYPVEDVIAELEKNPE